MAKIGEGDPRWIVSNRADGANVNQWHWTESDLSGWAKNKTKELLDQTTVETDKINVKLSDVVLDGEVSVNTRKQKTFLFYELNLTVKWQGKYLPNDSDAKGTIKVPYISEENDEDDFEVNVTVDDEITKEKNILKDELRKQAITLLKQKIPAMLQELKDTSLKKTNLQPKEQPSAKVLDKVAPIVFKEEATKKTTPSKPSLSSFTFTEKFACTPRDIFECLLFVGRVRAYAGSDAIVGTAKGDQFKLFGGSVEGENEEVIPEKKIVQKWRFSSWPANVYSTVTINLEDKGGKTLLTIEQTGIPSEDKERTEIGWRENFFRRIKGVFGFGTMM